MVGTSAEAESEGEQYSRALIAHQLNSIYVRRQKDEESRRPLKELRV